MVCLFFFVVLLFHFSRTPRALFFLSSFIGLCGFVWFVGLFGLLVCLVYWFVVSALFYCFIVLLSGVGYEDGGVYDSLSLSDGTLWEVQTAL